MHKLFAAVAQPAISAKETLRSPLKGGIMHMPCIIDAQVIDRCPCCRAHTVCASSHQHEPCMHVYTELTQQGKKKLIYSSVSSAALYMGCRGILLQFLFNYRPGRHHNIRGENEKKGGETLSIVIHIMCSCANLKERFISIWASLYSWRLLSTRERECGLKIV
jgi:hypothetical protein